jgi:hypothetical protein
MLPQCASVYGLLSCRPTGATNAGTDYPNAGATTAPSHAVPVHNASSTT